VACVVKSGSREVYDYRRTFRNGYQPHGPDNPLRSTVGHAGWRNDSGVSSVGTLASGSVSPRLRPDCDRCLHGLLVHVIIYSRGIIKINILIYKWTSRTGPAARMSGDAMAGSLARAAATLAAAIAVTAGLAVAVPAAAATASSGPAWRLTVLTPPPGYKVAQATAVGCASAGSCVAAGWSTTALPPEESEQPYFVAAESHGFWARASLGSLPANAFSYTTADVNGIACPATGSCVAVGTYDAGGGAEPDFPGFIAVEQRGSWRAFEPLLPANTVKPPDAELSAVTCTGPGACVAVGYYYAKGNRLVQMATTESRGRWQRAVPIGFPAHPAQPTGLASVACIRAGSCAAVGIYSAASGVSAVAVTALERNGRWQPAKRLRLPAGSGPGSALSSVSCLPSSATCVAIGWYQRHGQTYPMLVTLSDGRWGKAVPLTKIPAGVPRGSNVTLTALSCARGFCLAAGAYQPGAGPREWLALTIRRGSWHSAAEIKVPTGIPGNDGLMTGVGAAACTPEGACTLAGYYTNVSGGWSALVAARR
jgi:hypothetical protein